MAITKIQSESLNLASLSYDTGTVTGAGGTMTPAFEAYASSAQSLASGAVTKIQYNVEHFDTDNCYDTSTYRFTPNVAGKYYVYARNAFDTGTDFETAYIAIYKNGGEDTSTVNRHEYQDTIYTDGIIICNGSTDYIEIYMGQWSGSTFNTRTGNFTIFGAYKIIE